MRYYNNHIGVPHMRSTSFITLKHNLDCDSRLPCYEQIIKICESSKYLKTVSLNVGHVFEFQK